jgi:hypothetical protein
MYSLYKNEYRMNIELVNLLKSPYEGDLGRKKKNTGDEPI